MCAGRLVVPRPVAWLTAGAAVPSDAPLPSAFLCCCLPCCALQTFQDDLLQLCGRAHDAADVYRAIEAVHAAGVPSWSLDLMSGLPQVRAQAPLLPLILLAAVPTALPLPHSPPCDLQ